MVSAALGSSASIGACLLLIQNQPWFTISLLDCLFTLYIAYWLAQARDEAVSGRDTTIHG